MRIDWNKWGERAFVAVSLLLIMAFIGTNIVAQFTRPAVCARSDTIETNTIHMANGWPRHTAEPAYICREWKTQ